MTIASIMGGGAGGEGETTTTTTTTVAGAVTAVAAATGDEISSSNSTENNTAIAVVVDEESAPPSVAPEEEPAAASAREEENATTEPVVAPAAPTAADGDGGKEFVVDTTTANSNADCSGGEDGGCEDQLEPLSPCTVDLNDDDMNDVVVPKPSAGGGAVVSNNNNGAGTGGGVSGGGGGATATTAIMGLTKGLTPAPTAEEDIETDNESEPQPQPTPSNPAAGEEEHNNNGEAGGTDVMAEGSNSQHQHHAEEHNIIGDDSATTNDHNDDPPAIMNNNSSSSSNSDPNKKSFFLSRFSKWRKNTIDTMQTQIQQTSTTSTTPTAAAASSVSATASTILTSWRQRSSGAGTATVTTPGGTSIPELSKAQPITFATLSPGSINCTSEYGEDEGEDAEANGEDHDHNEHHEQRRRRAKKSSSSKSLMTSSSAEASSSSGRSSSSGDEDYCSSGSYDDDEDEVNHPPPPSSTTTGSGGVGSKVTALQWAAATVVDSVQQGYFKGRYGGSGTANNNAADNHNNNQQEEEGAHHQQHQHQGDAAADDGTMDGNNNGGESSAYDNTQAVPSTPTRGEKPTIATTTPTSPSVVVLPASHTFRILQSPQSSHVQKLMQGLQSHEYIMLLGKGMLGVNLKQAYLKESGVFVDYLVSRGAADQSKIIHAGDQLLMIGDKDVRRGTIQQVPQQIAIAKRPVRLIWATGCLPGIAQLDSMHVAVSLLHTLHTSTNTSNNNSNNRETIASPSRQQQQQPAPSTPSRTHRPVVDLPAGLHHDEKKSDTEDEDDSMENNRDSGDSSDSMEAETGAAVEEDNDDNGAQHHHHHGDDNVDNHHEDDAVDDDSHAPQTPEYVEIPMLESIDGFCNPPLPPLAARQAYHPYSAKRNNERFSVTLVCQAALVDPNIRAALRHALLLCAADGRRFPFLSRNLAQQEESLAAAAAAQHEGSPGSAIGGTTASAAASPNALLMLYIEMLNFVDNYGVTPPIRRRQIAHRIAHKFFLPTRLGNELVPPMFDFHAIASDTSLRRLEAQLLLNEDQGDVPRDIFYDFQIAALDFLSQESFVRFLVSADCARMRAYLRSTAPYVNVPLHDVLDAVTKHSPNADARNYFCFLLSYLMCQTDKEGYGEHDEIILNGNNGIKGMRVEHAAHGLVAAIMIRGKLLPAVQRAIESSENNDQDDVEEAGAALLSVLEHLWESFVAPHVGALGTKPLSNEAEDYLIKLRTSCEDLRHAYDAESPEGGGTNCDSERIMRVIQQLKDGPFIQLSTLLAEELVCSYATNVHPRFREHKFHEWMCQEFSKARFDDGRADNNIIHDGCGDDCSTMPPRLPSGCVKRLLQKAEFPPGVAPHKPGHSSSNNSMKTDHRSSSSLPQALDNSSSLGPLNADIALVFGTTVGLLASNHNMMSPFDDFDLCRYACESVRLDSSADTVVASIDEDVLTPDQVPPTLESYAVVPPSKSKPFSNYTDAAWISSDGWEISLIDFLVPRADAEASAHDDDGEESDAPAVYGVSLVLRATPSTELVVDATRTELVEDSNADTTSASDEGFVSPVSFSQGESVKVRTNTATPIFNEKMSSENRLWTERVSTEVRDDDSPVTVGLCLLSHRNVILSMRDTLAKVLHTFSGNGQDQIGNDCSRLNCNVLVNLLGNFAHQEVEQQALRGIVEPFLRHTASPWIERPLSSQRHEFEQLGGNALIQNLSPIPLALLFVTALLEQKIVITSSRRSLLLQATTALTKMLRPLKWCHLLVPRVPSALASDLLQYPAPFILGLPSEDPEMTDLIRDLPDDVTLVDLDIGRVILAPLFAHQSELGRGVENSASTARELRSQVLYLSQCLGSVFGNVIDSQTWACDRPTSMVNTATTASSNFDALCGVCRDFLNEMVAGTASCCYWIEEELSPSSSYTTISLSSEPTILLDEDRFFYVKGVRHRYGFKPLFATTITTFGSPSLSARSSNTASQELLPLSLEDFDLILEAFLRCQSMNAYIGNCSKSKMAFY